MKLAWLNFDWACWLLHAKSLLPKRILIFLLIIASSLSKVISCPKKQPCLHPYTAVKMMLLISHEGTWGSHASPRCDGALCWEWPLPWTLWVGPFFKDMSIPFLPRSSGWGGGWTSASSSLSSWGCCWVLLFVSSRKKEGKTGGLLRGWQNHLSLINTRLILAE